jgi:PhzF family phenazine biosynthesis protein
LTLNFPVDKFDPVSLTEGMTVAFNIEPQLAFKGKTDYMLVFKDEEEIKNLIPDLNIISKWEARGVIVTAKGNDVDFVARFFAPQSGINEDPVTGSAYTTLIPYWANESGKDEFTAVQLSSRKGYLYGKYLKDRVEISGKCVLYLTGIIYLE